MTIYERALTIVHDGDVVGTVKDNYILDCKSALLAYPEQLEADPDWRDAGPTVP